MRPKDAWPGATCSYESVAGGPRPMDEESQSAKRHLKWVLVFWVFAAVPGRAADLAETTQLFRSGKYSECVQSAEKAIAENDFSENYRLLKLRSEMELGRYADALKTLDEGLRRFPYSLP